MWVITVKICGMYNIKYQYPFIKVLIQASFSNFYNLGTQGQILAPTHVHSIIVIIFLMKFQIDKNYQNFLFTQFLQATIAQQMETV
jgi:hypothetical protein